MARKTKVESNIGLTCFQIYISLGEIQEQIESWREVIVGYNLALYSVLRSPSADSRAPAAMNPARGRHSVNVVKVETGVRQMMSESGIERRGIQPVLDRPPF